MAFARECLRRLEEELLRTEEEKVERDFLLKAYTKVNILAGGL